MIQQPMRPRVLIFSTAYLPHIGGSELAIEYIAERLTDFDIDLVTGRLDGSDITMEKIGRVRVFRVGGRWSRLTLVLPKLLMPFAMALTALRLMRRHRYSLLHAYQASQAAVAACLVKLIYRSIPLILTLQEGKVLQDQSWLTRTIRQFVLRRADAVTAISDYLAQYARRFTHVPVHCIPNGVDIASLRPRGAPEHQPHKIVTVSRLVEKNNIANLIRALVFIRDDVPDATLVIVGSGRLLTSLRVLVADLKIAEFVEFTGAIPHADLGAVLASAGVFARPSLSEGLGSAFLEAMAAGVPVVASAVGGIPDIIHDGDTGLFCDPNRPESIAQAIVRLMVDQRLREHIVAQSHQFVKKYDWSIIARKMVDVYQSLI